MQGTNDPSRVELLDAAALCRHLVPEGSVHAFLANHRKDLFPAELFADLFPSGRGRPSVPADQVATVMVLQALEGLSDREAAQQLACNIAWKVAAGLALTDQGFHPTVLTLWRSRLRASDRPERVFQAVRAVIAQTGVLKGRQRRALDSTLLDDAVATRTRSPSWLGRSGGCVGWCRPPRRCAWAATTTTMTRASRPAPGTTPRREPGW
jgi:hypothetical protein